MAEINPDLDQIIADAVERAVHAYFRYQGPPKRGQFFRDIWVTTSGHPCVFCAAMESLMQIANVPVGDKFPVPIFIPRPDVVDYLLNFATNPPAHPNCQCHRVLTSILS